MQDWLSARAAATPEQTAIIFNDKLLTYAQLDRQVSQTCYHLNNAMGLHRLGEGAHVAVLMPNTIRFVILIHAIARSSNTLIPLNARLSVSEQNYQINQAEAAALIHDRLNESEIGGLDALSFMSHRNLPYEKLLETPEDLPVSDNWPYNREEVDLEATQAIVFTSGTSGKSKGVEITFGNHFYSAMTSAYRLGLNPNDRWLSVLPLYHVGGLAVIFRSTLYGITTVLHDRFDIDRIQHSFDHHGITMISLVPTMLYRMMEAGVRWPDSLRLILLGGAAASLELLQRAFDMGLPIAPTYGLTEAASQVATMRPEDARKKPGSVGKPLMFTSVRIADENGESVSSGEYGEVLVSGPTVMKWYYKNDEANAKTLRNGELHTGDIGYLDEDGDLWLVQRRSDLIVSGGENVYPAEVETVLRAHPAVKEAVVVGAPHMEWGQQVAAAIQLDTGATLTQQELTDYSREHLAGYKQPRHILFVDEFPQTASGKIKRGEVSKLFNVTG